MLKAATISTIRIFMAAILAFGFVRCGTNKAKASEKPNFTCEFLEGWSFKLCENVEAVCYTNDVGLSCFKKEN